MKHLFSLALVFLLLSCSTNSTENKTYIYPEVSINFDKQTRITSFLRKGKPVRGRVIQNMENGSKCTWEVENGYATKQTVYYKNGTVERILEMRDGKEHKMFVMFFSDGKKYVEQFYENGNPIGTWYRWNKKGLLVETIEH